MGAIRALQDASPFMKKRLFSTILRLNVDRKQTRREKKYLGSSGTKYLMTPQPMRSHNLWS